MGLNIVMVLNFVVVIVVVVFVLIVVLVYLYKNNEDVKKMMDELYKDVLILLFEDVLKFLGLFLFEFGKIYVIMMMEFYK